MPEKNTWHLNNRHVYINLSIMHICLTVTPANISNVENKSNIPSDVPTRIAVGVARPSAQGQDTTWKEPQNTFQTQLNSKVQKP